MTFIDDLPEEILLEIFGHIGYFSLQKKCILVSTKWLNIIRNSNLSSQMRLCLGNSDNTYQEIANCLDRWPKLRTFHCPQKLINHIDFQNFPNIQNVVTTCYFGISGYDWFDGLFALTETLHPPDLRNHKDIESVNSILWKFEKPLNRRSEERLERMKRIESLQLKFDVLSHYGFPNVTQYFEDGLKTLQCCASTIKDLDIRLLCGNEKLQESLDLLPKSFPFVESLHVSTCKNYHPQMKNNYQKNLMSWMSLFEKLRRIEIIGLHDQVRLVAPPNKMYLLKEVYITMDCLRPFTSAFFKGSLDSMPNLELWMFGDINIELGHSSKDIKAFLNNCRHLKRVLHTRRFHITWGPFSNAGETWSFALLNSPRLTEILHEFCSIVNKQLPLNSTEISITVSNLKVMCVKEFGQRAIVKDIFKK